ncbi:MAG: hypothetical protein ACYTJ0_16060 [Planctomycetota bacterium]
MKTLWNMLSFLAMVNLLALLMLVAWLWRTGRLDRDRLHAVRDMLTPTVEEVRAAEEERLAMEEQTLQERLEADRRATARPASAARIRQISRVDEQERLAMQRLADERQLVLGQINEQMSELEQRRSTLDSDREQRAGVADAERRQQEAEQLQKAVGTLQAIPPRLARDMLIELVGRGRTDQAVAYLDAMQPRSRARVIKELKDRPDLAADLLEELRTIGSNEPEAEEPSNALDAADPD